MDLDVVGRHALFFDDDASAAFVNSGDALVEWHSLQIDRYDVRHLLSAPPPPRRRNRNSERLLFDDPSLESLLDQERYFDLPLDSDQPEVEEDEKPMGTGGYNSVAFSYGNTDDSADHKITDAGMESSGYLPPFPVPENLLQSLPPTEKLHQIIARTAIFVSKHGGQSEIILRVKQGDNPTFGFLMPDHHLHSYFRYLVEHPELLHSEIDGNSLDERKKADGENNSTGIGGALSMLGSVYGSGEEEDGDDTAITEKDFAEDSITVVNTTVSRDSEEPMEKAPKDESISRNLILSNKEKVHAVKKNSLIIAATKPKSVKNIKKEESSFLFPAAAEKSKNHDVGTTSKIEAPIIEPPPELKRLIGKIVEFISRNGKQFEATLIEQDSKPERFPFLLPSNQYHPYYLKVLQKAQESKVNGNSSYSGKDDPVGRGTNKRTSGPKRNDSSSVGSDFCDLPLESDRKEKFKMVIGKSKKETQEPELNGTSGNGAMVDAAAAAAILQAATRGIKNSDSQTISSSYPHAHSHVNISGSVPPSQPDNSAQMSDQCGSCNLSAVKNAASEAASVTNLTEEQKLKAERLKRAKMFVAMLKSGSMPSKTGVSRCSSAEPAGVLMSSGEANLSVQEKEGSLDPGVVDKISPTGDLGERPSERLSKRKYRSRSGGCDEDEDEDGHSDKEKHEKSRSRIKYKSIKDDKVEDAVEKEKENKNKHYRKRHHSHSSSEESSEEKRDSKRRSHRKDDGGEDKYRREKDHKLSRKKNRSHHSPSSHSSEENENGRGSSEEDRDHKHYKRMHRSRRSHKNEDDSLEDIYEEEKDHKRSSKRRRSHHSSRESSRRRHSSKQKKELRSHSHRSSKHHSRDKHRHKREESSRDKDSRRPKHGDELQHDSGSEQHKRGELEEGEMSPGIAAAESREITTGNVESSQRASSHPYDTTDEVPDDLRLKIRAMLMATRL